MKLTKIGDFLKRSKIPIDILDSEDYSRVTIRINHNGVSLRDTEVGKKIGTKKQFILKAGQFIVSKIDARYGAFGIAPLEVDNAIITGNFWAYDVDFSKLNIEWFNQFTNSPDFYDLCERASAGITHRKYLNETFFLNYEIMLPTVEEQLIQIEKIKTQKVSFGELTSELTHQINLVKKLRQAFLREAMQGKLVKSTNTKKTGNELLAKIKAEKAKLNAEKKLKKEKELASISEDEIPFEIPEHWSWCRLGEIAELKSGNQYTYPISDSGIMYVKVGDMNIEGNEYEIKTSNVYYDEKFVKTNDLIKIGSIIFPKRGGAIATNKRRTVLNEPILVDSNTMATIPNNNINFNYFLQWFSNVDLSKFGNEGVIPQVNNKDLNPLLIPLPPLHEQEQIVAKLDELMAFCDGLEQSIKESQGYNEMLLQQVLREALQGEVKVTEL
jgi:type I restriction enzyme S subunit